MGTVVIRCDGSSTIGMGHLIRCIALADELQTRSVATVFAVRNGPEALKRIAEAGHDAVRLPETYGPEALLDVARQYDASVFFLDQRDSFSAVDVDALRRGGRATVVYDDLSERRLAADVCIYPPIPQVAALDWHDHAGDVLKGWEWVLLRPEFSEIPARRSYRDPPRILITMGGADPEGFTFDALDAAHALPGNATVVIGPMMARADEVRAEAGEKIRVVSSPPDMVELMLAHDLALASFGVSAYELAACGVPMALWALTDDHRASASALAAAGIATVAAHPGRLARREVMALAEPWIRDAGKRKGAGAKAQSLCDGRGVTRIADKIVELTEHRT